MATIYAFVKLFDKEQYAQDFLNGRLFMNTIRSFNEHRDESGELRGDKYEGIIGLYQPSQIGELNIGGVTIPKEDLAAPIIIYGDDLLNHNVFCIYSLNSGGHETVSAETLADFKRTLELHHSCFGLGKYCVVIYNASEFIARSEAAIRRLNINGTLRLVDYFDEHSFHGHMPTDMLGYQKCSRFKHQREYRIKIDICKDNPKPYILDVGDLSDIAKITTPEKFNNDLKIRLPDGSQL